VELADKKPRSKKKPAKVKASFHGLVEALPWGKRLPDAVYVSGAARQSLPEDLRCVVDKLAERAGLELSDSIVLKLSRHDDRISFLDYPGFWSEGFPLLRRSTIVAVDDAEPVVVRDFEPTNAPVLHRKEEMLSPDDGRTAAFRELTAAAEALGLFDDVASIGHRIAWEERLRRIGVAVEGHHILEAADVQRHRTALTRYGLSTPMQTLWRYGFLNGEYSVFDYGCGRGDDLSALKERGIEAAGWDPHFMPNAARHEADVVNLGFVLNVIESQAERRDALVKAFSLTKHVLVVGVLIGGRSAYEKFRLFRDGVLTARGTFQKYFSQSEFCGYLEEVLKRQPIPVAPGIALVFRTDEGEQRFLVEREVQRPRAAMPRPSRERAEEPQRTVREPRLPREPKAPRASKWDSHKPLLDEFWATCVNLGRQPEADEFAAWDDLRVVGTPKTVFKRLLDERGSNELLKAREERMGGLSVYLALSLFERRKSFGSLPPSVQRDIKGCWGSYEAAKAEAELLLFACGRQQAVKAACGEAASAGLGYFAEDRYFQTASENVPFLPPLLRIYVGCASRLVGGASSADVIAIDVDKSNIQLLTYDDFIGDPFPRLVESIRVGLRKLHVDFSSYDPTNLQEERVLYFKSKLLMASHPAKAGQAALEDRLLREGILEGKRPTREYLRTVMGETSNEVLQTPGEF
jgi:DNA phosphorothioation-associated putative methyltransferase